LVEQLDPWLIVAFALMIGPTIVAAALAWLNSRRSGLARCGGVLFGRRQRAPQPADSELFGTIQD
jgi:hypothetical protein